MEDLRVYFAHNLVEGSGVVEDWVLVKDVSGSNRSKENDDSFAGVALMAEKKSGHVVFLSTRKSPDADRWSLMPSLECFKDTLQVLDLHKSRYLQELNGSIGDLRQLRQLMLTRCSSLKRLPNSIGNLSNLTEVGDISDFWCTSQWPVRSLSFVKA